MRGVDICVVHDLCLLHCKRQKNGHEEFADILQQIYGEQYILLLANPVKRRNILFRKYIKSGVRLSDKYKIYSESNGLTATFRTNQ